MLHTLLLNSTYEPIGFRSERDCFRLLAKDKVEVVSEWDEKVNFWNQQLINHPAIIKLKYHVRWVPKKIRFHSTGVFRRDLNICQYCSMSFAKMTVDHVVPKSRGGKSSWDNCVTSCQRCNNFKDNRTPEEAQMILLKKPQMPKMNIINDFILLENKHKSWADYIPIVD